MKEKLFIIFSLAFITLTAQDIHFSQFSAIKASLNPALIGYQQQDYQIQLQRRSQWESVTKPFTTFSVAINRKNIYNNFECSYDSSNLWLCWIFEFKQKTRIFL